MAPRPRQWTEIGIKIIKWVGILFAARLIFMYYGPTYYIPIFDDALFTVYFAMLKAGEYLGDLLGI